MCGITGVAGHSDKDIATAAVHRMNDALQHRGPDDAGVFADDKLVLGHRRLSIIDLSQAGHQPMLSADKSCWIVFNGEIYNFNTLKQQLSDYPFQTHTDTEVIIAAYQKWGDDFVQYLDGMFAIALYDVNKGSLMLVRDRLGVKPLYYAITEEGTLLFASEIRSILASGMIKRSLNTQALGNYLTFQSTIGQQTLINGVKMMDAGTYGIFKNGHLTFQHYWQISAAQREDHMPYENVKNDVRNLVMEAVGKRLIADVPLGAFLSGGIDSSAVVAAMKAHSSDVNTFNINFSEENFSEAKYARMIANKFGTKHTQIDLQPSDFMALIPQALLSLDYPSTDGANTYVVSKAVKDAGISVAISGIGGDEWFGGYPVFKMLNGHTFDKYKKLPLSLRRIVAGGLRTFNHNYSKDKQLELLSGSISDETAYYAIRKLFSGSQISTILNEYDGFDNTHYPKSSHYSDISVSEWNNYLMPVLLRDTDQMGMAHALEIREPLLDYKLVNYVLSLPDHYKNGATPKSLFVDAMGDLLPAEIVNRPKMGFVLPWEKWLKQEMKSTVDEGLNALCNHPAFNAMTIREMRNNYFEGKQHIRWNMIWNLAVLGNWMKNNDIS
ncbi:MAG: asparagine synthase (glutamine-hydrolyzing) [Bacteroidota bacterium]